MGGVWERRIIRPLFMSSNLNPPNLVCDSDDSLAQSVDLFQESPSASVVCDRSSASCSRDVFDSSAQLIGDSILRRLFERYPTFYHPFSKDTVVSGVTVAELKKLMKRSKVHSKVILLVGVNNLLNRDEDFSVVNSLLKSLIDVLKRRCSHVFICELLPIGRSSKLHKNIDMDRVNSFIRSFKGAAGVTVIPTHDAFLKDDGTINFNLFATRIKNREDNIHPNHAGLHAIHQLIRHCLSS